MTLEPKSESPPISEQFDRVTEELRAYSTDAGELVRELRTLLMTEAELARAEVMSQVTAATRSAGYGLAAAVMAATALILATLTVMYALDTAMPRWVAALLTTLIVAGMAGLLGLMARRGIQSLSPIPRRTLHSLKEDFAWAKRQMRLSER